MLACRSALLLRCLPKVVVLRVAPVFFGRYGVMFATMLSVGAGGLELPLLHRLSLPPKHPALFL